jgi:four helix bundle protein
MDNSIKYQSFTELVVWQEARKFQLFIFKLTRSFPAEERFLLVDQLVRASRSIAANIAEGHGRYHFQEQIHFCRLSRGSRSEVLNHVYTALDCNYITKEKVKEVEDMATVLLKLLNGYIFFLKNQKTNQQSQPIQSNQHNQQNLAYQSNQHTPLNQQTGTNQLMELNQHNQHNY